MVTMVNQFRFVGVFLCLACALSCAFTQAQDTRPNILWIVCEDISPYLESYGNHELKTPFLNQLASEGVRYTRAYTTAGVCAPSRSSIITGMYQTSIGTQHMRTTGDPKYQPVPSYSAVVPEYVKCFPEFLRKDGYYCTNNTKQDYQFAAPVTVWDENGPAASFRNRPSGKPFFSVFNFAITHESFLFPRKDSLLVDPESVTVPPIYPDIPSVRHDIARLFSNIQIMDEQVGEIISMLKEDGLYDNTVIFFYSDHGGALPWMKREILERGTHIPLIIRFPGSVKGGSTNDQLVSAVDFAPTVLSLARVKVPEYMQGRAFLGAQQATSPRQYIFAARDRMDTEYDRVRMVRDSRYRYLYNYMPDKPYYQDIAFRLSIPMMKDLLQMKEEGELGPIPMTWFNTKPVEELYDVANDPFELTNLASDPAHEKKLIELRTALEKWKKETGDRAEIPEKEMISQMWQGGDGPPATATPEIRKAGKGVTISCATKGASIGYRIVASHPSSSPALHTVKSWDFVWLLGGARNGDKVQADPVWQVYNGDAIPLASGDTLKVNAMRIGYKASTVDFVNGKVVK